jgi:hypothetical protein
LAGFSGFDSPAAAGFFVFCIYGGGDLLFGLGLAGVAAAAVMSDLARQPIPWLNITKFLALFTGESVAYG